MYQYQANKSLLALLVSLCLFVLPCVAQRQSYGLPEGASAAVKQVFTKALLRPSDGTHNAEFGNSSAINSSGNTIVVGAPGQGSQVGEVYVFVKPATGWANATETTKLTVPGLLPGSSLGFAVAISSDGNTIVASGPYSSPGNTVYVFSPTAGSWSNGGTLLAELTTSDVGSILGFSLAISTDAETVVAGGNGVNDSAGAVYVYRKPSSGWTSMTQTAKLTASNAFSNQALGSAVAISGNTIAAGASEFYFGAGPGAVYVFTKPASGWANGTQTAELLSSDGQGQDAFGSSVAISGNTIVAGAPYHQDLEQYEGAVYVFVEPASGWANATQTAELTPANGNENSELGFSVAISGNFILAGAAGQQVGTTYGQADAFVKPATGWANGTEAYDLIAKPATPGSGVGGSVSLTTTGPVVISGATSFDSIGAVDVFE